MSFGDDVSDLVGTYSDKGEISINYNLCIVSPSLSVSQRHEDHTTSELADMDIFWREESRNVLLQTKIE